MKMGLKDRKSPSKFPFVGTLILALLFTVLFGGIALQKYRSFSFNDMDLAVINQIFWNTVRGRIVVREIGSATILNGGHAFFIAFVLSPLYFLARSPLTLLFLQSAALGAGALPVYLVGRRLIKPSFGFLFAFCYLIYPAMNWVALYEFHPVSFATPLVLLTFYFYLRRRWTPFVLCVLLSLSCREDVALPVFAVGAFALLSALRRGRGERAGELKWALLPLLSSVAWFLLCITFIQPHFRLEALRETAAARGGLAFYSWLGDSPLEIVETLLFYPGTVLGGVLTVPKMAYLLHLFVPVAFAPLLSGGALVMPLVSLAEGLLSQRFTHYSIRYQYSSIVTPLVFLSSIYGVRNVLRWRFFSGKEKYVFTVLLFSALVSAKVLGPLALLPAGVTEWRVTDGDRLRRKFVESVPAGSPVLATFQFSPKLSMRPLLFYFYHVVAYSRRPEYRAAALAAQARAEYALVDFNDPITFYDFFRRGDDASVRGFLTGGKWRLLGTANSIALFGRGAEPDLRLVETASPGDAGHPLGVRAAPGLELSGYTLRGGRVLGERVLELSVYFTVGEGCAVDYLTGARFTCRDEPGYSFQQELYAPFRIYPSSRWSPGEVVVQRCSLLVPDDAPAGVYDLSLALLLPAAGKLLEGRVVYEEASAVTLERREEGSGLSAWRGLWAPVPFDLSTINSLRSPRFLGWPLSRLCTVASAAVILCGALLYRIGSGVRGSRIVSLVGSVLLLIWILYDVRVTCGLTGTAVGIWRSYVRPPPAEKSFPVLGDFYSFVELCRETIPEEAQYHFHPYPDWPFDCRVHYFLYPRRIKSATWNNVIEGRDIPYHVVCRNPAVRYDGESRRLRSGDSYLSRPGRVVRVFDEDSFIFLEDR